MFKEQGGPPLGPQFNKEEYVRQQTELMRKYILDTYVKPEEYFKKGTEALIEGSKKNARGGYFKGELISYDPGFKAYVALRRLSDDVRKRVTASGLASNIKMDDEYFAMSEEERQNMGLSVLLKVLSTGQLKGWCAKLENPGGPNVFTSAPFILLSNKDEKLADHDPVTGDFMIKSLRTVLVNDQYESMVDDLKKRFPGISFRTAEEIDDAMFDKKNSFKSFEDVIKEKIDEELKNKK